MNLLHCRIQNASAESVRDREGRNRIGLYLAVFSSKIKSSNSDLNDLDFRVIMQKKYRWTVKIYGHAVVSYTHGWNCRGGWVVQPPPQFMFTDAHFWVKIGFKFQSLGKISNISTSEPPSSFRPTPTLFVPVHFRRVLSWISSCLGFTLITRRTNDTKTCQLIDIVLPAACVYDVTCTCCRAWRHQVIHSTQALYRSSSRHSPCTPCTAEFFLSQAYCYPSVFNVYHRK